MGLSNGRSKLAPALLLVVSACSNDTNVGNLSCTAEQHCYLLQGTPTCEDGYQWEDPSDDSNLTCVPVTCEAESKDALCSRLGYECGAHEEEDNCGTLRNINCGGCGSGTCSPNGECVEDGCQAACDANQYTTCSCSAADPCGWRNDDYCDEQCAISFPSDHFTDTSDCDSETPPDCRDTNDGYCDEPEGTGRCPEGSDATDCAVVCESHAHMASSGLCECESGYAQTAGGDCVSSVCDFTTACAAGLDCTWNYAQEDLACSAKEGEATLSDMCIDADNASTWDACGPFQVCVSCTPGWDPTECQKVCRDASDCAGYFGCGVGTCQLIPGSSYGYCR